MVAKATMKQERSVFRGGGLAVFQISHLQCRPHPRPGFPAPNSGRWLRLGQGVIVTYAGIPRHLQATPVRL